MRQIIYRLQQFDRKTLLFGAAALLLIFNLGRMTYNYYQGQLEEVASQKDLFEQYKASAEKLPELEVRVSRLEQQAVYLERHLFIGKTIDEISSAVQIMMQKMVTGAGLTPESLRPIKDNRAEAGKAGYEKMMIKMRLSGSLPQFIDFYSRLYRSGKLFLIDSITLRSYKGDVLKSYLVIQVYYKLRD
ncbi:MAG: hypothetical protein ACQES8_09005 [Thermodesulfobacteriota bacterium]